MARRKPRKPPPPRAMNAREKAQLEAARAELHRRLDCLRAAVEFNRRGAGMILFSDYSWAIPPDANFVGPPHPALTSASPGMTAPIHATD